ncbi:hypothetical protein BH23BAC2_BH23BAC2_20410 [soil metagenome]
MRTKQITLNPLDIAVLIKIASMNDSSWHQKPLADALHLSQSEISKSIARSKFAGLLDPSGKKIMKLAFIEFLQYGVGYAFPEQPGAIVRGIPTAHSAKPLNTLIDSNEQYVWPSGKGKSKGQSIIPLYPAVTEAVQNDEALHEMLALVDAIRVGRAREKELAVKILKHRILDGE